MKIGRISGMLIIALFLLGIAVSVYAAKGPIESALDSYRYQKGGIVEDQRDTEFMHQEEFAWTPNYISPKGVATIVENEHGVTEIRIEANGLQGSCEFMAYLVNPEAMKVYSIGDQGYAFKSDENGNGHFSFTVPLQSAYDSLPMTDLRDWNWRSIDIQMKPDCVGSIDSPQKVLALDLERLAK